MSRVTPHTDSEKEEIKIKAKLIRGFTLLIIILFSFTTFITYAERSFEITEYQARVKILENGDIQVREIFEYDFDGDFDGIIRTIGIKGSDGFKYFKASEYFPEDKELNYGQSIKERNRVKSLFLTVN